MHCRIVKGKNCCSVCSHNALHKSMDQQYTGTVMTSFDHVMIPTRGNWFQTNPLEHESDDRAVLPMVNLWHFSGKFDQHNVTVLWFRKTEIQDRARILVLVRVLRVSISKIYSIFAQFLQINISKQFQFLSH